MHPDDGTGGVEQVEIEVGFAGDWAVQARLQERRPLLLQDSLRTAVVPFAHAAHPWHHHLWQGPSCWTCWQAFHISRIIELIRLGLEKYFSKPLAFILQTGVLKRPSSAQCDLLGAICTLFTTPKASLERSDFYNGKYTSIIHEKVS